MKLSATDDGALDLEEIPPFLFGLLTAAPARAASADPRVNDRFYPDPALDDALVDDWKSLVQPGLEETFLSAREVVAKDLRTASDNEGEHSMEIPPAHMDAWLNTLNQARLAIAAENSFGEADLAGEVVPDVSNPRSLALFQISFYGFLQECLVKLQS